MQSITEHLSQLQVNEYNLEEPLFLNDFDTVTIDMHKWLQIFKLGMALQSLNSEEQIANYKKLRNKADFYYVKQTGEMGIKLSNEPSDYISTGTKVFQEIQYEDVNETYEELFDQRMGKVIDLLDTLRVYGG